MAVVYVDDVIFLAKNKNDIKDICDSFTNDGDEFNWEHTAEGTISTFLGIDIKKVTLHGKQGYQFTQTGLINKVLKATGMTDCNPAASPTVGNKPVSSNVDGMPAQERWYYPSIVGMILYLVSNSCSDISFTVHQAARFTHSPKVSHEDAVLRIVRYLWGTATDGLIHCPDFDKFSVDCYVDADFAGLWGVESPDDPISVKSRTGYVIMVAGCPVTWCSKLQSLISLSTLESEYIALSHAMRDMIPLKLLVNEVLTAFKTDLAVQYNIHSTVYEDNHGCLRLATTQRMTPLTKHIGTSYHWFHSHVKNKTVVIVPVKSALQKADIFTKSLPITTFKTVRKLLCNW